MPAVTGVWREFWANPIRGVLALIVVASVVGLLASPYYLFAVLPGAALIALLLLARFPQLGYFLIVLLVPFDAYRGLTIAYGGLTISKLVGVVLVMLVFVYAVVAKPRLSRLRSDLWPLFLVFFVVALLSSLLSKYPVIAFNNLRMLAIAYMFFGLTMVFMEREDSLKLLAMVIVASLTLSSVLAIVSYVFDLDFFVMNLEAGELKRGTGGLRNPNHFASLVVFGLPFIAHMFFAARTPRRKAFFLLMFAANIVATILTYSRSAAVVLAFVLILLVITHRAKLRVRYLGLVMAGLTIAIIGAAIFVPSSYWERQRSMVDTSQSSIRNRISYLIVGWEAMKQRPILGSGLGSFPEIFAASGYAMASRERVRKGEFRRAAHNTYVEVVVGTGIVGSVIFLLIMVVTFVKFDQAIRNFGSQGKLETASLVSAYRLSLISMLAYFLMLSSYNQKYVWATIAVSQAALALSRKEPEEPSHGTAHTE